MEFYHGPSANFGAEIRANERFAFYGEFGKYIPNTILSSNFDQKGYSWLVEGKRYFFNGRGYLSMQYMQSDMSYIRSDIIGYSYDYSEYIEYDVTKTFQDLSIRMGGMYVYNNRWTFNPYIGLGIRRQNAELTLTRQEAYDREYGGDIKDPNDWIHRPGITYYAKLHLGLRVGIKIF